MKNILKYAVCMLVLSLASCESWLDIKPVDRISGRALFESRGGFQKALNGVYVELTDRSIYGREMTAGMLDILAQYYRVEGTNNYFDHARTYAYEKDDYKFKQRLDALWSKTYNLIVNLNIIIEECGEGNEALNDLWFGIIKGEALALRAFLHLDMLRLFGPTHSKDPDGLYIPYVTNSDQSVSPLRSSSEIKTFLLKDLTEAIALLEKADPIIENGVMFSDDTADGNALRYRQSRMNYYAARALLARAYLWFGDKPNAYAAAKELLADVGETVFPFVNPDEAIKSENPDRVFSPEIMFGLYDSYRTTMIFNTYFIPTLELSQMYRLAYAGNEVWSGRVSQLFVTPNDLRYKAWISSFSPATGGILHYISKYRGSDGPDLAYMKMVPLIKISEVYLIAAECAPGIDGLGKAKEYLSRIRVARTVFDLESADTDALMNNIEWEFRREFLAEGQMFYFYKRLAKELIPDGKNTGTQTVPMGTAQYVVPLPDSEKNERLDN